MTKPISRLPDWRPRLIAYLSAMSAQRFRPGKHDCALFVAGAVHAQTGLDFSKEWRGYRTLDEGVQRLNSAGFSDHIDLIAHHLPEIAPLYSRPGDIAVVQGPLDMSAGVVQGAHVFVLSPNGMSMRSLADVQRGFQI